MENAAIPRELRVDVHFLKFSQVWVVLLSALAFIFNWPILTLLTGIILLISAISPAASPFRWLYRGLVLPAGWLKPRIVEDDPAPHRFAQAIGATFLLISSLFLFLTSLHALGWALDLIVFVLAGINLAAGFCAGCFVYYHLGRLGILPRVRYSGGFRWRGV